MTNVGIIRISEELLMRWLDFKGGKVRNVTLDDEYGVVNITIEHPDMPEVKEGDMAGVISPSKPFPTVT